MGNVKQNKELAKKYGEILKNCGYMEFLRGGDMGINLSDGDVFWKKIKKDFGFDKKEMSLLKEIADLTLEGPYSHSNYGYQPSFRSSVVSSYNRTFLTELMDEINFLEYGFELKDVIKNSLSPFDRGWGMRGTDNRLAIALRKSDEELKAMVKEAILGEGDIVLTDEIIQGVIKSGIPELLEDLGKLLLAAKNQEGVRQSIMEWADIGSAKTHAYFIKLCIDNKLTRFSSIIRAFGCWTGLAYDNVKPAVVNKCFELAYKYLQNPDEYINGVKSPDVTEVYMALWAKACYNLEDATDGAEELITTPEKYRRLVGWHFLSNSVNKNYSHKFAVKHIDCRDGEELAWITQSLYRTNFYNAEVQPANVFPEDITGRREEFYKLAEALKFIGNKKTKFTESVFPWVLIELNSYNVAYSMFAIARYDFDKELVENFSQYLSCVSTDIRSTYYRKFLNPEDTEQRLILLEGLNDKSVSVKQDIVKILDNQTLSEIDLKYLTSTLSSASADLRKSAITLISKQSKEKVAPFIDELIADKNEKKRNAGEELKSFFEGSPEKSEYTAENGYGLFDVNSQDFDKEYRRSKRLNVKIYSKKELIKLLTPDKALTEKLGEGISNIVEKNKDLEVESICWGGRIVKELIGDDVQNLKVKSDKNPNSRCRSITDFWLGEEIFEFYKSLKIPLEKLAVMCKYKGDDKLSLNEVYTDDTKKIFEDFFNGELSFGKNLFFKRTSFVLDIILAEYEKELFDFAMSVWMSFVNLISEEDFLKSYSQGGWFYGYLEKYNRCMLEIPLATNWRELAGYAISTDEQRKAYYNEKLWQYVATDKEYCKIYDVLELYNLGIVSDDMIVQLIVEGPTRTSIFRDLTKTKKAYEEFRENSSFSKIFENILERVVTIEENRGELPTPLTELVMVIRYYKGGAKHFVNILSALGKDKFFRGYYYSGDNSKAPKQVTLSRLLKACYPADNDTAETLKAEIEKHNIPKARMLQAIMYAPQWAIFAEEALGIKGLASAVWLFHAHINETINAEKETIIAVYSPVSQQEFADGAFDKNWFFDAYNTVGDEIFNELYKNAMYITNSSNAHKRSQFYTDAILGKLDKKQIEKEVSEKRNQERLRAYGLIPLDKKDPSDALKRYEFIQKYLKESKQFGSARRESEGKAVRIALQNLAITTGFDDVERMTWSLESEKTEGLKHLLIPQKIDEIEVNMQIDEDGTPSINVVKKGKVLKSLPKQYSKNEYVLEIQIAVKDLKEQKSRARIQFENAMTARTLFNADEIVKLLNHPVLSPMISKLVLCGDGVLDFPKAKDNKLYLGEKLIEKQVIIAHPYDFITDKSWTKFQKYLFKNGIMQPFKQIFREYYPITQDEKDEKTVSRRYAGHQVQPKKTVALLKTRGWTVDYEEGLQRVYHKENLIVKMYAMADWFLPSEIESPTLETVQFFRRDNYKPVDLAEVPPVIFSEIMRDIDLVVSVAHVGGVDPQASASTIEMRVSIAKELITLLKIDNVTFQSAHAQIKGKLGEYSVHMGSGIVHKSGVGMIPVLAVQSQQRGRIFLPFADNDPRTAEIMSKILLFSEDDKIKDPTI